MVRQLGRNEMQMKGKERKGNEMTIFRSRGEVFALHVGGCLAWDAVRED